MNRGPQANCHIGLSEIGFDGADAAISGWLATEMQRLNAEYVSKLILAKATSNIMMILKND